MGGGRTSTSDDAASGRRADSRDRASALRVLADIDDEIRTLTDAIGAARMASAVTPPAPPPADATYAEIGEMVLAVQRKVDALERDHASRCIAVLAAADAEVTASRVEAHRRVVSILDAAAAMAAVPSAATRPRAR